MATTKDPIKKEAPKHAAAAHAAHPAAPKREHKPAATAHAAPHAAVAHGIPHAPKGRYTEAVGRRKTAIARVRITAGKGEMIVNGKDVKIYFSLPRHVGSALSPLEQLKLSDKFDVSVHVSGGGINAQAEAIRHGLSRAIVLTDIAWKPRLRAMGFMTRDSRMVERKKYGLRKARRAPQWAKR
jgi:small subunit ribosomal protein S9